MISGQVLYRIAMIADLIAERGPQSVAQIVADSGWSESTVRKTCDAGRKAGKLTPVGDGRYTNKWDLPESIALADDAPVIHRVVSEWKTPTKIPVNSVFALGEAA